MNNEKKSKPTIQTKKTAYDKEAFAKESIWKLMAQMCIPAVLSILVMVIYNMADIYFIGQMGDPNKVTAISLCMPLMTITSALGSMIGSGCCSCISIANGRKDYEKVKQFSSFSFYISIIFGIIMSGIVFIGFHPILNLIGTSVNTIDFAKEYLIIIGLGFPLLITNTTLGQVVRAEGAAKESMFGNMLGTITNIVLDPLLILSFGMGIQGAAIATLAGNLLSVLYYCHFLIKKSDNLSIHPKYFTLAKSISITALSIGLPTGISTILASFANIFENNLLVAYSDNYVASISVAGKATMVIGMLQIGISMGISPVVAYNYGANNISRLKETIKKTAIVNVVIGLTLSVLCRIFGHYLVAAFINDPEIIETGVYIIGISTLVGPFIGIHQLCTVFLQSTEKASYATLVSLLRQGLVFIPALYILNYFFGFKGIVWCQPIATLFSIVVGLALSIHRFQQITNKKKDVFYEYQEQ